MCSDQRLYSANFLGLSPTPFGPVGIGFRSRRETLLATDKEERLPWSNFHKGSVTPFGAKSAACRREYDPNPKSPQALERRAVSLNRLTALIRLLTRRLVRRGVITIRAGQRRQRTNEFGPQYGFWRGGILPPIGRVAPFERCPTSPFTTRQDQPVFRAGSEYGQVDRAGRERAS